MISIVIPAHNEAAGIGRCLSALRGDAGSADLDIVVVANGCQDRTAAVAASFGPGVRVLETGLPSKRNALNLGDAAVTGFPRFYVDADVVMTADAVRAVWAAIQERPGVLAAAPAIAFDLRDRPWSVRAFYDIWSRLPYCREGTIGAGVYALSEAGRRRFDEFPDVTADDTFVRLHFAPHERLAVEGCQFTVTPPTTLAGIVRIRTRSHFGDHELRARFPHLFTNKCDRHGLALLKLLRHPTLWPKIAVYAYVRHAARLLALRRWYFGDHRHWERDDSSRIPAEATSSS